MGHLCTEISENGQITKLSYLQNEIENTFPFYPSDSPWAGPVLYEETGQHKSDLKGIFSRNNNEFKGENERIRYSITIVPGSKDALKLSIKLSNIGSDDYLPESLGLRLGIDCSMQEYPRWNSQLFPTHLRCEKTHFGSYFMSPEGKILALYSPDPIASWSLSYNETYYGPVKHFGHRIQSINLKLLHSKKQPTRHPDHLNKLSPGQSLSWSLYLHPLPNLSLYPQHYSHYTEAPAIHLSKTTLFPGEQGKVWIYSDKALTIQLFHDDGMEIKIERISEKHYTFLAPEKPGYMKLKVSNSKTKVTEALLYIRQPWSWYLKKARQAALDAPQKASTHAEAWYGFYSAFAAAKHFPEIEIDRKLEKRFLEIASIMFDLEEGRPLLDPGRIQNSGTMISALVLHYKSSGNLNSIMSASKLADWLLDRQDKDGSLRGGAVPGENKEGSGIDEGQISSLETWIHYTAVLYPAKSVLELVLVEEALGLQDEEWKNKASRHRELVDRAVKDLSIQLDNIGTEGEITLEDGMISCSAMQIGMKALCCEDDHFKLILTNSLKIMLGKHRCLEQEYVPDARMRGGTLRFWEGQYDILAGANFLSSPHGWSSFKTYAFWYAYLLTGELFYIEQLMDSLGAAVQMISLIDGRLRWAFQVDPCITAEFTGPEGPKMTCKGEEYHDMISYWWQCPEGKACIGHQKMSVPPSNEHINWTSEGGCSDQDVHEHFKCLEECVINRAYYYDVLDNLKSWNLTLNRRQNYIEVKAQEGKLDCIHFNIDKDSDFLIDFIGIRRKVHIRAGMTWVYSDGVCSNNPFLKY